jgi:hypothetical protein
MVITIRVDTPSADTFRNAHFLLLECDLSKAPKLPRVQPFTFLRLQLLQRLAPCCSVFHLEDGKVTSFHFSHSSGQLCVLEECATWERIDE